MRRVVRIGAALGVCAVMAQTAREVVVHGFRVPDYDEAGSLRSQVFGERARQLGDGYVEITGLRVETYIDGDSSRVDLLVESPQCRYHERRRLIDSEETLVMTRDNLTISGRGYTYDPQSEQFTILNEAEVVIRGAALGTATGEENE